MSSCDYVHVCCHVTMTMFHVVMYIVHLTTPFNYIVSYVSMCTYMYIHVHYGGTGHYGSFGVNG